MEASHVRSVEEAAGGPVAQPAANGEPTLPPGPGSPALVQLLRWRLRPIKFFRECERRFGECFTLRFGPGVTFVFFTNPDAIREILAGDPDVFLGGKAGERLAAFVGANSLLVLDGDRHSSQRRLMLPAFHGDRMAVYCRIMREVVDQAITRWPRTQAFPILHEMQRITLEVMVRAVFGVDEEAVAQVRTELLRFISPSNELPATLQWFPIFQRSRFARTQREKNELLIAQIARRRELGTAGRDDILSMLIEARDDQGRALSDDELRDQMFTLLMAGYETTATSLAWAFYRVLAEPGVLDKVRAELRRVLGGGPLEAAHVSQLEYLDAVIKETMRLDPVVQMAGVRTLRVPIRIAGRYLPAGVTVAGCIYLTHRRADLWPEPERFNPDRFLGARPRAYSLVPFGGGDRRCLGAAFATYEMKVVLAEVLSRGELHVVPGYRARPVQRLVTIAPSAGMPVVLESV